MYNGESRLFIDILRNRLSANILKFAQTALDRRCLSHETDTPSISTASIRSSLCLPLSLYWTERHVHKKQLQETHTKNRNNELLNAASNNK